MSKADLHKLGKTELLQIIYEQEKQIASLKKEVEDLNKKINDRTIELEEAGSIAEASLRINKIFEEAQKAADEYLNSVKKLGQSKQKVTENITNEKDNKDTIDNKEVERKELYIDESELDKDKESINKDDENDFIDVEFTEIVEEDNSIEKSIPVEKGKELVKVNFELSVIKKSLLKKIEFWGLMIKEKIHVLKLKRDKKRLLNKIKQIGKKEIQDLKRKEAEKIKRERNDARKKALNSLKTYLVEKIKSLNDKIKNYIEEKKKEIEKKNVKEDYKKDEIVEEPKVKEKPKRPRGRPRKKRAYSTIKIGYELVPLKMELIVTKKNILTKFKDIGLKILEKFNNFKLKREKKKSLNKIKQIGKEETLNLKKEETQAKIQNKIKNIKNNLKSLKDVLIKKNKDKKDQKAEKKEDIKKENTSKTDKKDLKKKTNSKSTKFFKKKEINLDDYDLSVENIEKELNNRKRKENKVKFARTLTYFGIVIVAFAIIIATRIFNVLQVSGDSMEPSLYPGDLLISTKIFGYEKGDMIAFYYNDSVLIKRIIATEGDIVYIDDIGNVYVNSQKLEEDYVKELAYGNCDITFPYRVPSKELFVLGDNRAVSVDSRSKNIGTISEDRVLGKIVINLKHFSIY